MLLWQFGGSHPDRTNRAILGQSSKVRATGGGNLSTRVQVLLNTWRLILPEQRIENTVGKHRVGIVSDIEGLLMRRDGQKLPGM